MPVAGLSGSTSCGSWNTAARALASFARTSRLGMSFVLVGGRRGLLLSFVSDRLARVDSTATSLGSNGAATQALIFGLRNFASSPTLDLLRPMFVTMKVENVPREKGPSWRRRTAVSMKSGDMAGSVKHHCTNLAGALLLYL